MPGLRRKRLTPGYRLRTLARVSAAWPGRTLCPGLRRKRLTPGYRLRTRSSGKRSATQEDGLRRKRLTPGYRLRTRSSGKRAPRPGQDACPGDAA
jgi:hypothetical protein